MQGEKKRAEEIVKAHCQGDGLPQNSLESSTCQSCFTQQLGEVCLHSPRLYLLVFTKDLAVVGVQVHGKYSIPSSYLTLKPEFALFSDFQ